MPPPSHQDAIWEQLPPDLEPPGYALRRDFLLGSLPPGARLLDLGCGEGRFAADAVAAGARVLAADVSAEPLRRLHERHPQLETKLLADGPWELPDAGFDAVWAGEVIEHVADTGAWMSEVRRVLRSGGLLLVSTPDHGPLTRLRMGIDRRAFERRLDPLSDHLHLYTAASLGRLLAGFGFEQVHIRGAGGPPGARRALLARAVRARF